MAEKVNIFEVGARDGLQNEARPISLADKLWLVERLLGAGVSELELGAFVRPDRVPRMADTDRIFSAVRSGRIKLGRARAWSLVPNRKGMERAVAAGARNIAVFTATTESFAKRNIGMSIAESFAEFRDIIREAKRHKMKVRGYVSTAFGCPFEGKVAPKQTLKIIVALAELGVTQVSVGDTIGVATPRDVDAVLKPALRELGRAKVAGHFHDTRGTALANALRALELGVRTLDSSAGGLGGCPFAPSATGNLATEDLIYMLDGMGIHTGISLKKLSLASVAFAARIKRPISSKYLQAFAAQCES